MIGDYNYYYDMFREYEDAELLEERDDRIAISDDAALEALDDIIDIRGI